MSFEGVDRRSTLAVGLRRNQLLLARLAERRPRALAASSRRVGQRVGAAFLAAGLLIALARGLAGSAWVDVAALSALLIVATAAMLGMSRAFGDGADGTLSVLLAGWTAALVVGIALWSTPLRESPLLSLAALLRLASLASVGQAITYLLSFTLTRLVLAAPER